MTHVGIDIGQFVADPYTSGIQRVLQYLAREWPMDEVSCDFVIPFNGKFLVASAAQASSLFDAAFEASSADELRTSVATTISGLSRECPLVDLGALISLYTSWLLPEVSYSRSVLDRLRIFKESMPVTMIGYDALPMTDPENYRFKPGTASQVSEYFQQLADADSVVCISDYAREAILDRLRRDRSLPTDVGHPGGDHVAIPEPLVHERNHGGAIRFLRVGTLEARKMPVEILTAFVEARKTHNIELTYVGGPSASDLQINQQIEAAAGEPDSGVTWVRGATDREVWSLMREADVFLSLGIEGYGIPVLESIRLGTPVLYGGVQPAAEIMNGSGASPLSAYGHDDLVSAFGQYGQLAAVAAFAETIEPERVPRWSAFVQTVAQRSVNLT